MVMMHLLRSLFVGYFVAVVGGTIAVTHGYDPLSVVLSVWLSGSVLTVAIAASVTPLDDDASTLHEARHHRTESDRRQYWWHDDWHGMLRPRGFLRRRDCQNDRQCRLFGLFVGKDWYPGCWEGCDDELAPHTGWGRR